MFPDVELIRSVQQELDEVIRAGVTNLVQLLRNTDSGTTSSTMTVKPLKAPPDEELDDEAKLGTLVQAMISERSKKRAKNHENKNISPLAGGDEDSTGKGANVLKRKIKQSIDVQNDEDDDDQSRNMKSATRRPKKKQCEKTVAFEDLDNYIKKSMKKKPNRLTQRLLDKGLMKSPMMTDLKGEWKP